MCVAGCWGQWKGLAAGAGHDDWSHSIRDKYLMADQTRHCLASETSKKTYTFLFYTEYSQLSKMKNILGKKREKINCLNVQKLILMCKNLY